MNDFAESARIPLHSLKCLEWPPRRVDVVHLGQCDLCVTLRHEDLAVHWDEDVAEDFFNRSLHVQKQKQCTSVRKDGFRFELPAFLRRQDGGDGFRSVSPGSPTQVADDVLDDQDGDRSQHSAQEQVVENDDCPEADARGAVVELVGELGPVQHFDALQNARPLHLAQTANINNNISPLRRVFYDAEGVRSVSQEVFESGEGQNGRSVGQEGDELCRVSDEYHQQHHVDGQEKHSQGPRKDSARHILAGGNKSLSSRVFYDAEGVRSVSQEVFESGEGQNGRSVGQEGDELCRVSDEYHQQHHVDGQEKHSQGPRFGHRVVPCNTKKKRNPLVGGGDFAVWGTTNYRRNCSSAMRL
ncbi:hypothetical protein C0J52_11676 [Blattella germanica]|nr:hypothetical protein C0J52_11676 [Blattella germanica]